jgi:TP901 family phage tail tape measure protein
MARKEVKIKLTAEAQGVVNAFTTAGKSITKFGTNCTNFGNKMGTVFNPLMRGLAMTTAAIATGTAALAGVTLKIGAGFEDAMLAVEGVTQSTAEEMDNLAQKARDIGKELPVTAQQTADAMYNMASAGMSTQEILQSIDATVALSISQGYGLAESAGLMVSTLRAFNLEASESGRVIDVFSNGISSSMLTMDKLTDSLKYAGPIANAFGISIEETVAAMEALSNAGLSGEQVGTGLRGVIAGLADPTAKAQATLDRLGVTTVDATGKLRSLKDIFVDLKNAGAEGYDFLQLFERRMATPAAVLTQSADKLDDFEAGLRQAGRAQELLNKRMEGFKNLWIAVISAMQEGFLTAFDGVKTGAKAVVVDLKNLINTFVDWARANTLLGDSVSAFFDGLGLGLPTIDEFKAKLDAVDINGVIDRFYNLGDGIRSIGKAFKVFVNMVPWKWLADNLNTIVKVIIGGWAIGKVALIIGSVTQLGLAYGALAKMTTSLAVAIGVTEATSAGGLVPALCLLQVKLAAIGSTLAWIVTPAAGLALFISMLGGLHESVKEGSEAMDVYKTAITSTVEELKKLTKEEIVRDIKALEKQMASMEAHMGGPNGSGNVKGNAQYIKWQEQLDKLKAALKDLGDDADMAKAAMDKLTLSKQYDVDAQENSMGIPGVDPKAPEKIRTFSQDVASAVQQAASEFATYAMQLTTQTADIKSKFGLTGQEAGAGMKDALLAKANELSDGLVDQFDNPALKSVLIKAFEKLGKESGSGFYSKLSDIMNQAMGMVADKAKTLDEQIADKLKEYKDKFGGDWQYEASPNNDTYSDKVGYVTNGIASYRVEFAKAKEETKTGFDFNSMLASVDKFKTGMSDALNPSKWGWGPNQMTNEVTGAIAKLSDPAAQVGAQMGTGIYDGIMAGVKKAVVDANSALQKINVPGSSDLATAINDKARED